MIFKELFGNLKVNVYLCTHNYKITIKYMTAVVLKQESDNYWNLIKDASNEVKLSLIKRLSDALRPVVAEKNVRKKKYTADDFAGIWDDDHFMDAEDINKAIRDARHVKSNRDEFWDKFLNEP